MFYDTYTRLNWLRGKFAILKELLDDDIGAVLVELDEVPIIRDIITTLKGVLDDTATQDLTMEWCGADVKEHFKNINDDIDNTSQWIDNICIELGYQISDLDVKVVGEHFSVPKVSVIDHAAKRGPVRSAAMKALYQLRIFVDDIQYRKEKQNRYSNYLDEAISDLNGYVGKHYKNLGSIVRGALYDRGQFCSKTDSLFCKHGFMVHPDGQRLYVKTAVGAIQC